MAKVVRQYRYYSNANQSQNYPHSITREKLMSGNLFFGEDILGPITQLGIQTLPGVKFRLNDGLDDIIVGVTGIYELELEGIAEITRLRFNEESLRLIENSPNAYLIIDVLYEMEE